MREAGGLVSTRLEDFFFCVLGLSPGAPVLEAGQACRACTGLEGWLLSPTEVNESQQLGEKGLLWRSARETSSVQPDGGGRCSRMEAGAAGWRQVRPHSQVLGGRSESQGDEDRDEKVEESRMDQGRW